MGRVVNIDTPIFGPDVEDETAEERRRRLADAPTVEAEREAAIRALDSLAGATAPLTGEGPAPQGVAATENPYDTPPAAPRRVTTGTFSPGTPGGDEIDREREASRQAGLRALPPSAPTNLRTESTPAPRRRVVEAVRESAPAPAPRAAPAEGGDVGDRILAHLDQRRRMARIGGTARRVFSALAGQRGEVRPDENIGLDPRERQQIRQEAQRGAQQRTDQAEMRDPQSPRNQRWRAALAQQGIQVPEGVTLADAETRGLYEAIAEGAQRERIARAGVQARNEGRDANREDQQAHQDADREDRQAFSAEQQRQRLEARAALRRRAGGGGASRAVAGMSEDERENAYVTLHSSGGGEADEAARIAWRSLDGRHRQTALVQALNAQRVSGRAEAGAGHRQESRDLARGTAYHTALERSGIPRGEAALSHAEQLLRGASDGEVREALAALGSPNRMALLGGRPARIAQAVQSISNVELKNQSGAAVSDQEFARFQSAAGQGSLSAEALRAGIGSLRRLIDAQRSNLDAAYPDVSGPEQAAAQRRARAGHIRIRIGTQTGDWPEGQPLPPGATRISGP